LTLVATLEDQARERAWVGRAAYEALSASQRAALREALKGIDRLVTTLVPDRVHRLAAEHPASGAADRPEWGALADTVAREVSAVLEGLRGDAPVDDSPRGDVDLNVLVRRVTEMARTSLEATSDPARRSIQLHLEMANEPLVARTSPELVVALVHAIENAVEAMPQGGEIQVRTSRGNGHAVISVQDGGPGVAALDDAFAPLVSTKAKPHYGLGLAVIRSVVSAHGGTATLVSPEGGGALLQIRLPLAAATALPVPRRGPKR
jgi:signal transduction histidine kinase